LLPELARDISHGLLVGLRSRALSGSRGRQDQGSD
jgi:hypothetical protein